MSENEERSTSNNIIGHVLSFIGIGMLLFCFTLASSFIDNPFLSPDLYWSRIIFLVLMIVIGSFIISKGMNMIDKQINFNLALTGHNINLNFIFFIIGSILLWFSINSLIFLLGERYTLIFIIFEQTSFILCMIGISGFFMTHGIESKLISNLQKFLLFINGIGLFIFSTVWCYNLFTNFTLNNNDPIIRIVLLASLIYVGFIFLDKSKGFSLISNKIIGYFLVVCGIIPILISFNMAYFIIVNNIKFDATLLTKSIFLALLLILSAGVFKIGYEILTETPRSYDYDGTKIELTGNNGK